MKKRNIISLMIVAVMAVSGSLPGIVNAATDAASNSQEDIIIQEVNEPAVQAVSVDATVASEFSVSVPKSIQLDGSKKSASYKVTCNGDFPANKKVTVTPAKNVVLSSVNKNNVTAAISQDKTEWLYDDNTEGTGTITASDITAGSWSGVFDFNIAFEDKECNEDEHDWQYETIEEEKQVLVKEAYDEPVTVTEPVYVCNTCGETFGPTEYGSSSSALKKLNAHQRKDLPDCAGYHSEEITYTYYIHHAAEYKTETIQKNVSRTCRKCQKFEELN